MKQKALLSILFLTFSIISDSAHAQWQKVVMPGSRGGAVTNLCVNDSFLFAGLYTGVYRSSDNGVHWEKVNPFLPPRHYNPWTFSLVANGQNILAGFAESGIYMSSDNGENWEAKLVIAPRSAPSYELAVSGNWIIAGGQLLTSLQSTDNGTSWNALQFNHVNSALLQDSFALAATDSGIFRSINHGTTWHKVHSEHSGMFLNSPIGMSDSLVLIGINSGNWDNATGLILLSSDSGLTWNPSDFPPCGSINSIVFTPSESETNYIFVGTDIGVFSSSDKGKSWSAVNNGLTSTLIFALAFKSAGEGNNPVLFAGTGDGLFHSTDFGETWNGTGSPSEWIFASADDIQFGASSNSSWSGYSKYLRRSKSAFHTSVIHSTDYGLSWTKAFEGILGDSIQISSLCVSENQTEGLTLFAGGRKLDALTPIPKNGFIFTSTDNGKSWKNAYSDPAAVNISMLGANSTTVLANVGMQSLSDRGLYRTTDNGNNWIKIDTSLYFLSAVFFGDEKIYTGGSFGIRGRIYNTISVSTDNGEHWNKIKTPIDTGKYSSDTSATITSLYGIGSHLFIGMQSSNFFTTPPNISLPNRGALYHLYFNGESWELIDSSFVWRSVFALTSIGLNLFAATDSGIFKSTDNGANWENINSGMNRLNTASLFISGDNLFASTINGLWTRPLSEITSVDDNKPDGKIPVHFYLSQNYPNPFNPSTQIKYSIPTPSPNARGEGVRVSLKVYNLLGQEVATLFEGVRQPGNYIAMFVGTGLASGMYLYRMTANNFVETKKLVLIK